MQNTWEKLFSCKKCGERLAIKKIKGTTQLVVVGKCSNAHVQKFTINMSNIDEWLTALDAHFFKCVKCDAPVTSTPFIRPPYVKILLKCPVHGKNEIRILPQIIYNKLIKTREEVKSSLVSPTSTTPSTPPSTPTIPNCQFCGNPTTFVPQYSRYFCYQCQRYYEEQPVVEKVRGPSEKPDLRSKLKEYVDESETNFPIAICEIPFELDMPDTDAYKIQEMLQDMITKGEIAGEVDIATGEVTFYDPSTAPPKSFSSILTTVPQETGTVDVVRDFDYVGGQVRFKVAVRNKSALVITNIGVELDIPIEFKLIRILPESSLDDLNRGLSKIDKLMPNSSQGIDYYLEPVACGTGVVAGLIKYMDAEGHYKSNELRPKEIAIKCPLVFTPEEANIAMVRNLTNKLNPDYRRWALPTNAQDSFKLLHEVVNQFEISHIQAFQISGSPYEVESWYYTRTKNTNHAITLRVNVSERQNIIDLTIACEDMAELTGLLAKIAEDFQVKIKTKLGKDLKPAFGNLKELLCNCGSPLAKLPAISEEVICNNCHKNYTWEMLG